jgi:8-oxo-dGTP pyrophosphatase MutT (NUDIX family)
MNEEMVEESAGCVLVQEVGEKATALLIRVRQEGFEVPKGHIEAGETREASALRELREETGLRSPVVVMANLGVLEYSFERSTTLIHKRVYYFAVTPAEALEFDNKPARTRELRWVSPPELPTLPLINEALRAVIREALNSKI